MVWFVTERFKLPCVSVSLRMQLTNQVCDILEWQGFLPPLHKEFVLGLQTPAGHPLMQLSSGTVYPETGSDPHLPNCPPTLRYPPLLFLSGHQTGQTWEFPQFPQRLVQSMERKTFTGLLYRAQNVLIKRKTGCRVAESLSPLGLPHATKADSRVQLLTGSSALYFSCDWSTNDQAEMKLDKMVMVWCKQT